MASRKAIIGLVAFGAAAAITLTGCEGGGGGGSAAGDDMSDSCTASGDITYLTNRTDLDQDGTFKKYVEEFNKKYPDVKVTVQAISNYQDDVTTRLSTPNGYGDVLNIPSMSPDKMPLFFVPIGKTADMGDKYRFLANASFDGDQYGLALGGNASGILYNTKVWEAAGLTTLPTTSDEYLADMKKIKDNTDAIPLYTNYKDGWPLGWTGNVGQVSGDADAINEMGQNAAPWTEGTDIYAIDSLMYDLVHDGLTEPDPITTNWEQSKGDLANGKIATMVLGSWAISQFQAAAETAGQSKDVVGYMPWPANVDGQQYAVTGGDFNIAISKNSKNKCAAKAWRDFMIEDSGYTQSNGMLSSLVSEPLPTNLQSLTDAKVELLEMDPAPAGSEALVQNIADKSKVDLYGFLYRQKMIDIARGQADGDKNSYFAQLNQQWGAAQETLAK